MQLLLTAANNTQAVGVMVVDWLDPYNSQQVEWMASIQEILEPIYLSENNESPRIPELLIVFFFIHFLRKFFSH